MRNIRYRKEKRCYDKANRENVLMVVIFPIVKLLNEKYCTQEKYSLDEIHNFSMYTDHWGNSVIQYEENKYVVKEAEIKQLERAYYRIGVLQ